MENHYVLCKKVSTGTQHNTVLQKKLERERFENLRQQRAVARVIWSLKEILKGMLKGVLQAKLKQITNASENPTA